MNTKTDSIWAAAAHLLRRDAEELRESITSSRDRDDWTGEEEAKADYDEHIAAADALASLSTVAAALPPSYLGGSLVANVTTGECLVRMHFGNAKEAERWFDAATDSREAAPKAAPAQPAQQPDASYAELPDERTAFEAQFPVPGGVNWNGSEYVVKDDRLNSYRCYRFVGQWAAWKARAAHGQAPAPTTQAAPAAVAEPAMTPEHRHAQGNAALLADILNRRPALNEGLRDAYARWTAEVYDLMGAMATEPANDAAAPKAASQPAEHQQEAQSPVAYRHLMDDGWEYYDAPTGEDCPDCEPLYTTPQPAAQQVELIGWIKSSEIDSAKRMGGSINLWLNKYDCDTPLYTHPAAPAAQGDAEDAARWHWLAEYLVGPRTDLDDEIVSSETVNELRKLVDADRARKEGQSNG